MSRLRSNFTTGTLAAPGLAIGATTIQFGAAPPWPTIVAPDIRALIVDYDVPGQQEIVWVTAFTAGATSGTILKGQEGTSDGVHSSTAKWIAGATTQDFGPQTQFNVLDQKYGIGTGQGGDDSAAILAAKADAEAVGGNLHFPAAPSGKYNYSISNGVLALGSGNKGLLVTGDMGGSVIQINGTLRGASGRVGDSPAITFGHVGDGLRRYVMQDIQWQSADGTTTSRAYAGVGLDGIRLDSRCELQRVSVRHFDAGITFNTASGQQRLIDVIAAYNYASLYLLTVGDDIMLMGCDFQNALFTGILSDNAQTDDWYSCASIRTHFGFSPYCIYQHPGATGRLSTSAAWYQTKLEKYGNAGIYSNPGFAGTSTAGTNSTDLFDATLAPFTAPMVGKLVTWGGGTGYATIATFVSSSHVTLNAITGAAPAVGQTYAVASGTRDNVLSGVFRDTIWELPVSSQSNTYKIAAFPSDYAWNLGAVSESNRLWLGHNAPASINMDSFAGQTKAIANSAPTVSVAGVVGNPTGWGTTLNDAGQPMNLTGATAPTRYVGGTSTGPPATGTFSSGDWEVDKSGLLWICTTGGTPGTWQLASEFGDHPYDKLIGQGFDSAAAGSTFQTITGTIYLTKIWTPQAKAINTVRIMVTTLANLTGAFVGIIDGATGLLLAVSADQGAGLNSGSVNSPRDIALTAPATPSTSGRTSFVYAAFLGVGTTGPILAASGAVAALANGNLAAASRRFATNGTGQTTLGTAGVTTYTLASNANAQPIYMAVL